MAPIEPNRAISVTAYSSAAVPAAINCSEEEKSRMARAQKTIDTLANYLLKWYTANINKGEEIEINILQDDALKNLQAIKERGLGSASVYVAYKCIYDSLFRMSKLTKDSSTLQMACSLFWKTNNRIRAIIGDAKNVPALHSALITCLNDTDNYTYAKAVKSRLGVELVYSPEEMTRDEQKLVEWTLSPHISGPYTKRYESAYENWMSSDTEKMVRRYPAEMLKLLPKRYVVIMEPLGAYKLPGLVVISPYEGVFHHEIFHWFDHKDYMKFPYFKRVYNHEDHIWNKISNSVPEKGTPAENLAKTDRTVGYASNYAKTATCEDQAETASMLFSVNYRYLIKVLSIDPKLKAKMELVTGCEYDSCTGTFVKVFSNDELKRKYGISEQLYYAKWSNINGRVLMDADYWNNILKGNQNGAN